VNDPSDPRRPNIAHRLPACPSAGGSHPQSSFISSGRAVFWPAPAADRRPGWLQKRPPPGP